MTYGTMLKEKFIFKVL